LSPVQAVVANITDNQADFVKKVEKTLRDKGFRAISDLRNEKIGFKIREHTIQKVPYLVIVGDQEVASATLSVRARGGADLGTKTLDEFIALFAADVANKARVSV
jgi:threonyl-tRNA synthetase